LKLLFASLFSFALSLSAIERNGDPCYEVSCFRIVYDTPHADQTPISDLLAVPIELGFKASGYIAPCNSDSILVTLAEFCEEEGCEDPAARQRGTNGFDGRQKPVYPCFHRSALQAICGRLLKHMNSEGFSGVSVQIAPDEISAEGGDKRRGRRHLTIRIRMAVVGEVGAYRLDEEGGERLLQSGSDRELTYIVRNSPMRPSLMGDGLDDLFSKDNLDDYVAFLNRHPNRRVDARIYPLNQENRVGIDYLVSENRPWKVFFDVGNTGNHTTGLWQETVGVLHTQLTGVDDVLRFDWTTDSFHSFYTFVGSYDRPILAWPKARWKLFGMFNRFAASDLGFEDKIFVGTQGVIDLNFRENAAQMGNFFFDFLEGVRYYNIHVTNRLALIPKGATQFASPTFGFQMEQAKPLWRFYFKFEGQTSPNKFLTANRDRIDLLGRLDTSKGWTILTGNFFTGFYTNPEHPCHEFVFLGQGQYAFNYRLIPQLKFVVGGFNTVRGYEEAINSGDSAFVLRTEYVFHLAPFFNPNPAAKTTLFGKSFRKLPPYPGGRADWDFLFRVFMDAARSVDNELIPALEQNSTLVSTGLGAEVDLWQNFMLRLDWGITLHEAVKTGMGHNVLYLNSTVAY